jgi:hypothetical protein
MMKGKQQKRAGPTTTVVGPENQTYGGDEEE